MVWINNFSVLSPTVFEVFSVCLGLTLHLTWMMEDWGGCWASVRQTFPTDLCCVVCVSVFVVCNSTMHHSCRHLSFMPEGSVWGFVRVCSTLFLHTCGPNRSSGWRRLWSWQPDAGGPGDPTCPPSVTDTSSDYDVCPQTAEGRESGRARLQRIASRLQDEDGGAAGPPARSSSELLLPPGMTFHGSADLDPVCCMFPGRSKDHNLNVSCLFFSTLWNPPAALPSDAPKQRMTGI